MPVISFNDPINISVQPTDIMYVTEVIGNQSGSNTTTTNSKPKQYGVITNVDRDNNQITVDTTNFAPYTTTGQTFYFFSKNRSVNSSGLLGYYSLVEFVNESMGKAEIFAVGTEYAPSSK